MGVHHGKHIVESMSKKGLSDGSGAARRSAHRFRTARMDRPGNAKNPIIAALLAHVRAQHSRW
jgi:hypothetical protein